MRCFLVPRRPQQLSSSCNTVTAFALEIAPVVILTTSVRFICLLLLSFHFLSLALAYCAWCVYVCVLVFAAGVLLTCFQTNCKSVFVCCSSNRSNILRRETSASSSLLLRKSTTAAAPRSTPPPCQACSSSKPSKALLNP